jgi:hypothetical protein
METSPSNPRVSKEKRGGGPWGGPSLVRASENAHAKCGSAELPRLVATTGRVYCPRA